MAKDIPNRVWWQRSDILIAIGVIAVVLMLIIPIPAMLLDFLIAVNFAIGLITLITVMFMKRAIDLSVFPTLLLISTVYRLAVNISSTRLILLKGPAFNGRIIRAFGQFVVGGNYVVGLIIFLILVAVQFIVITKGATRVAEVAARFTLDAMPGKQMAIDADLSAGLITEQEAIQKRIDIQREADFYGAMDGASKFVQGDVKVGLLITIINIVGGLIIGMVMRHETIKSAVTTYTMLTIGDGLVSQIPSLMMSTATGIIVTRAVAMDDLGTEITTQLLTQPRTLWIGAAFLLLLAVLPGFPKIPLIVLGSILGSFGFYLRKGMQIEKAAKEAEEKKEEVTPGKGPESVLGLLQIDPIAVEVGKGSIRMGKYLAMNPGTATEEIEGEKTTEPAFGLSALWIDEDKRQKAERLGYTVVDAPSVIATHLTEVIKQYAAEVLGRQDVKALIDSLSKDYPAVVEEVNKSGATIGDVQKVLKGLLREGVSIRDLVTIMETIADYFPSVKDHEELVELVRQALSRQICQQYADEQKRLSVITVSKEVEEEIKSAIVETERGKQFAMEPSSQKKLIERIRREVQRIREKGLKPVFLTSPEIRSIFSKIVSSIVPNAAVLSSFEIVPDIKLEAVGRIAM